MRARRSEVHPFSPGQIMLLESIADQAVIAIDNERLFNELKESLEQQAAASDILRVISSSRTGRQPVFQTILDYSVRLCEEHDGALFRCDGGTLQGVSVYNLSPSMETYV